MLQWTYVQTSIQDNYLIFFGYIGIAGSYGICSFNFLRKQHLELDMEHQTGSKFGKEYVKAKYCHPAYLTICRVHHMKCWGGQFTSWDQDCREKYQQPQICRWYHRNGRYHFMAESEEERKSLLMKVKEESEKAGLKLKIQRMKIIALSPITSQKIDGKEWK